MYAHMVGLELTKQVQGIGLAQSAESTDTDIPHAIFAHPTLSEAMHGKERMTP